MLERRVCGDDPPRSRGRSRAPDALARPAHPPERVQELSRAGVARYAAAILFCRHSFYRYSPNFAVLAISSIFSQRRRWWVVIARSGAIEFKVAVSTFSASAGDVNRRQ